MAITKNKDDEKDLFQSYYVDEDKFIVAINKGEVFKTSYSSAESNRQGGAVFYKQTFSYKFDTEFIKNNEQKLVSLGIIIKKKNQRLPKIL